MTQCSSISSDNVITFVQFKDIIPTPLIHLLVHHSKY
jgi:hypothetical protein